MKYFLHFVLICLGFISLPFSASTQEYDDQSSAPTTEKPFRSSYEAQPQSSILDEYPAESSRTWHEGAEKESDTFQAKFFNMLFILGLLIAFMMIASWSLKRMMRNKVTNMNQSGNIRVLETRYLSPRATLYLVQVEDKQLLIAESPTQVSFLTDMAATQKENPHAKQSE